jgi:hypothetical protein
MSSFLNRRVARLLARFGTVSRREQKHLQVKSSKCMHSSRLLARLHCSNLQFGIITVRYSGSDTRNWQKRCLQPTF